MTDPGNKGKSGQRNERLKAALRENLRRRKAQERGRDPAVAPERQVSEGEAVKEDTSR